MFCFIAAVTVKREMEAPDVKESKRPSPSQTPSESTDMVPIEQGSAENSGSAGGGLHIPAWVHNEPIYEALSELAEIYHVWSMIIIALPR